MIVGSAGFTGGLNIGDEYLCLPQGFDRWRDAYIRLTGSPVWSLQAIFLTDRADATGEILDPAPFSLWCRPLIVCLDLLVRPDTS